MNQNELFRSNKRLQFLSFLSFLSFFYGFHELSVQKCYESKRYNLSCPNALIFEIE